MNDPNPGQRRRAVFKANLMMFLLEGNAVMVFNIYINSNIVHTTCTRHRYATKKNSFCRAGSKHAENCSWSSLSIIAGRYPDPKLKDIFTSTIQYSHTLHKQYLKWVKFRSFDFLGETYASSWRNLRKLNDQMLLQGGPPILPDDPGTFQVIDTLIDWSTDRLIDWYWRQLEIGWTWEKSIACSSR